MSKQVRVRESELIGKNTELFFSVAISYNPEVESKESELKGILLVQESAKLIDEFKERFILLSEELGI